MTLPFALCLLLTAPLHALRELGLWALAHLIEWVQE
jgi:hypothetical protein